MLVLKRKEGQWVEIVHRSGDVLRLRVYDIQAIPGTPSRANLAFDDAARNFEIRRPERKALTPVSTPGTEADAGFEPAAAVDLAAADLGPFAFRLGRGPEPVRKASVQDDVILTPAGPIPRVLEWRGNGGPVELTHDGAHAWEGTEVVGGDQSDPGDQAVS